MAIKFMGQNVVVPMSIDSEHGIELLDSPSLHTVRVRSDNHRWEGRFSIGPMPYQIAQSLWKQLVSAYHSDTGIAPVPTDVPAAVAGAKTQAALSAGRNAFNSVDVSGAQLDAATYVKFANHDKVYLLEARNKIVPRLRMDVPAGTAIDLQPNFQAFLTERPRIRRIDGILSVVDVRWREAV